MNVDLIRERCEAWESMHRQYFPDDDERWHYALRQITAAAATISTPRILDLGCGPGTLTQRIQRAIPRAHVIGVDADASLVALAALNTPGGKAPDFQVARLGSAEASARFRAVAPFDAIVSSAVMHSFDVEGLVTLHRELRGALKPHGLLITVEQFSGGVDASGPDHGADPNPWEQWWSDSRAALPTIFAPRSAEVSTADEPPPLTLETYRVALREAGLDLANAAAIGASTVISAPMAQARDSRHAV